MVTLPEKKLQIEPRINDLIFRELIKRGYALEGNTHVWNIADSKLWYLTSPQAQAFLDLEKSKEYNRDIIQKEIDLITANLPEIMEKVGGGPVNLIDVGCGDGKKAVIFIDNMKGKSKVRYCPIDISSYMVEKAIKNILNKDVEEIIKFQWNVSDFENIENVAKLLRYKDYKKNFYLLLGNTLGNFEINELLYEIRSAMEWDDILLIGNGLSTKDVDSLVKSYSTPEVNEFLIQIPQQIGLDRKEVKFGTRFRNQRVEIYYTLLKDKQIEFQGKRVIFNKGDQIIVAVSYHYSKNDFISFMKMYFGDVSVFMSKDEAYALVLCKK
ncbi:MAG: L-histidine N(alpha)-methyltransferase [archaeon]